MLGDHVRASDARKQRGSILRAAHLLCRARFVPITWVTDCSAGMKCYPSLRRGSARDRTDRAYRGKAHRLIDIRTASRISFESARSSTARAGSSRPLGLHTNHAKGILACDFFVAVTATFRMLYVFVVIEHGID